MIAPRSLNQLVTDDPIGALKMAIVARLADLITGVKVVSHPGKIDIAEMVAKSIVAAPGIAVGWTRIRNMSLMDGSANLALELAAYIVVEAGVIEARRVEPEILALAIGRQILLILSDIETSSWGLTGITPPAADPAPTFVPLATIKDAERGVTYCAVTWTQTLIDVGVGLFDGDAATLALATDDEGRASMTATWGDGTDPDLVPDELRAIWQGEVQP